MGDLCNMSGSTTIQKLISRSWSSGDRLQFIREMELRMCKSMVVFETEVLDGSYTLKMKFNDNGSRLVRVQDGLLEVLDPRTRRVVHTLPRIRLKVYGQMFEFTDVDHELILDCCGREINTPELQLWDMRFSSSHVGRIRFCDATIEQYVYSKKERALLSNIYDFKYNQKRKILLYDKSSFSTSGEATPVSSFCDTWGQNLRTTWFGLAPDDSCLVFRPTLRTFLAVHNLSFATLHDALKQFDGVQLKIKKASGPITGSSGDKNELTHMVHDSFQRRRFKICSGGKFIAVVPKDTDSFFRVYSFDHNVPTNTFCQNPPTLTSTAQFIASADRYPQRDSLLLSASGEIAIAYDASEPCTSFYHLRAPVPSKLPIDLEPFYSLKSERPVKSMALTQALDIFVTAQYYGPVVWHNPRL
ncbi:uncharacterized protein LOC125179404 [Hyalella azteca]|uniref:Uncharacterized protein LOC125179404 n=1 Tax=Hyalella azteca TaxID=294128 RepID=A0A979FV71_HYAAZ|nr:uncharacterized protein LOC125179404 [Hyalella azteca]